MEKITALENEQRIEQSRRKDLEAKLEILLVDNAKLNDTIERRLIDYAQLQERYRRDVEEI